MGKKTIEIHDDLYQKLHALKVGAESIEQTLGRIIEEASTCDRKQQWNGRCSITVLGPPGSGKTMIIKSFFENKDPRFILSDAIEPTKETERVVYDWLDVKVSITELGHADYNQFLDGDKDFLRSDTDLFIYIFDVLSFDALKQRDLSVIPALLKFRAKESRSARIACFIHKIDLMDKTDQGTKLTMIMNEIKELGKNDKNSTDNMQIMEIHPTSLVPAHSIELFRVMRNLIFNYSPFLRQALLPGIMKR